MSFGLGSQGPPAFGGGASAGPGNAQASTGPALQEITTENLGFLALAGDTKIQLFPTGWPAGSLPPPTSSLFSISSVNSLIAAASPDSIVVATTTAVREAFTNDAPATDNIKPFTPQLTIPIGTRISQVAFSSDGSHLVISAETGGGLAVYETQALLAGNTQSTFELGTDQMAIRALVPNPDPESASLFAVVTTNGDLMMADMKTRSFVNAQGGKVLKSGVSCVSWSNKGKQLVAGLGNGSALQMTPQGVAKAEIPRPPDLEGEQHVSSAFWLENNLFLMAYTPSATEEGLPPPSNYRLITRQPATQNYGFQVLPEVCSPFGFNRQPSFQFMQRLRGFPPTLTDLIMVSSTSSEDVGLFTRASQPLSNDAPGTKDTFTMTSLADDSRRAAVPMAANMTDVTSAIGMALDLSSSSKVPRPIPSDDIENSPGPLPAIFILNHLGVLSGWWVVYSDSVRQGTSYPGLIAVGGDQPTQPRPQTASSSFGASPSQNQGSAFGSTPSLGSTTAPAFGSSSFGSPAPLGNRSSPWGGASSSAASTGPSFGQQAFGQSSFGSATPMGAARPAPAFGSASGLGSKPSLWGSPSQSATQSASSGSVFGQSSSLGAQQPTSFGSATPSAGTSSGTFGSGSGGGGFASFASDSGFSRLASGLASGGSNPGESIFKQGGTSTFDSAKKDGSAFGSDTQASTGSTGLFGSEAGFKLGTAWSNPNADKDTEPKASQGGSSLFGSGFASALSQAKTEGSTYKETDMMSDEDQVVAPTGTVSQESAADPKETATSNNLFKPSGSTFSAPSASGGLFGTLTAGEAAKASSPLGQFPVKSQDTAAPVPGSSPFAVSLPKPPETDLIGTPKAEQIAEVSGGDKPSPEPPLPPEPTSKASYTPGNSSSSAASLAKTASEEPPLPPNPFATASKPKPAANAEEAPLPPDFTKKAEAAPLPPDFTKKADDAPLPPDFTKPGPKDKPKKLERERSSDGVSSLPEVVQQDGDSLPSSDESGIDEEGSGVDVAKELHADEHSPDISPVSSFGTKTDKLSVASSSQRTGPSRETSKTLFGEIAGSSIPNLGPPRKDPESPRSPSPVRSARNALRAESSRSVSAPGVPLRADTSRKVTLGRPAVSRGVYPPTNGDRNANEEREQLAQKQAQAKAAAEQDLSDGDDEKTRAYLEERVESVLKLEPFIAHQDYVGHVSKPGIPGQVERVYRDINSMIDTLGLNARALTGFINGHQELYPEEGRTREDFDREDEWTLSEIPDLIDFQNGLEEDLASEELKDPSTMLNTCADLSRELSRLKARQVDLKHSVDASLDPELREALRTAPLSAEQSSMRHDLRGKYTELQRILAQCEEAVSMLKAKTASLPSPKAQKLGASKVPTVEAVERTINKMTSMFEKRSGDIDVLEAQMRTLNVNSSSPGSRENSPFMTPPPQHKQVEASPGSSVNGRSSFYTAGSRRSAMGGSMSVGATPSRLGRSPGKKMAEIDEGLAKQYAAKAARKREVRGMLKEALVSGEMRLRTLDDL